jgi:acetyl esterase/lipase
MRSTSKLVLATVAGAVNTANAYVPLIQRRALSMPVMAASLMTSEFPLQTIALQELASLELARRSGLRSRATWLSLAVSTASSVALANLHRQASRSGLVLESALIDELGSDYRSGIVAPRLPPVDVPLTRRQVALPRRGSRRRYLRLKDEPYGDFGTANHLDIWSRADLAVDARSPVLLEVPGGAWVIGRKTGQAYPLLCHLAERGWVCVAINYRVSPRSDWPAHIADVKRAIAWIKQNIARYGGDPNFIAITGGSAGGHLSALAALTPGYAPFQPGFEGADTTVQAAATFYGIYDFVDAENLGVPDFGAFIGRMVLKSRLEEDRPRWEEASPQYHIGSQAPPFFVIHGANDVFARSAQARRFADDLRRKSSNPVVFAELPFAQHGFDGTGSVRANHTVRAVERFLDYTYCTTFGLTGCQPG